MIITIMQHTYCFFKLPNKKIYLQKKVFYDALKRLNPSLSIKAPKTKKAIRKNSSNQKTKQCNNDYSIY